MPFLLLWMGRETAVCVVFALWMRWWKRPFVPFLLLRMGCANGRLCRFCFVDEVVETAVCVVFAFVNEMGKRPFVLFFAFVDEVRKRPFVSFLLL